MNDPGKNAGCRLERNRKEAKVGGEVTDLENVLQISVARKGRSCLKVILPRTVTDFPPWVAGRTENSDL